MKYVCFAFAFFQFSCFTRQESKYDSGALDSLIEAEIRASLVVGVSAAILLDGKLAWSKGYGYADRKTKRPFTPSTVMNIASISKTFTGASVMHTVEEGKLSLDEDINLYLPFGISHPIFPGEKITLRQLATHTSSIRDVWFAYEKSYHNGGDHPQLLGDYLKDYFVPGGKYYSLDNFLPYKPGTHREYSNIGAGMAGFVVESITGKKLNRYSKEAIFGPLKMNDTGWFLSEIDLKNHSTLYEQREDSTVAIELYGLATYPDGGVRTSVNDLAKFLTCIGNDGEYDGARILKRETVAEMMKPQFSKTWLPDSTDLKENNRGIFWFISGNGRQGHSGGDPGVATAMHYDPSRKIGVIFFMNTTGPEAGRAFNRISEALWRQAETWWPVLEP